MLKIMSKTDGFPSVFDFKSIHSFFSLFKSFLVLLSPKDLLNSLQKWTFFHLKLKGSGSLCKKRRKTRKNPVFPFVLYASCNTQVFIWLTVDTELSSAWQLFSPNCRQLATKSLYCLYHLLCSSGFPEALHFFFVCMWENRLLAESTSLKSHTTVNAALFINVFDISDVPLQSNFHFFASLLCKT